MPLKAKNKEGILTYISEAIKGEMYYCQICNQPMLQRRCVTKIDHFAHYSPHGNNNIIPCSDHWGYDKTEWHLKWQKSFPVDAMERVLEFHGNKHIADVLVGNVVVEFQHSPISLSDFTERNNFYTLLGYKVIWVFDLIDEYSSGRLVNNRFDCYYNWAYAKKLFREMNFDEVKATIYIQLYDDSDKDMPALERVKDVLDEGRIIKTDNNGLYTITKFIKMVKTNDNNLMQKPKAPREIDNCSTIVELWKESFSSMIVKNEHTSEMFYVFGKEGNIIRDYRTGKIRCKYAKLDLKTGYICEGMNFYNIQDEHKKIWVLVRIIKDKNYEKRVETQRIERERLEQERRTEELERQQFKDAETQNCNTIFDITISCKDQFVYVENKYTNRLYLIRIVNGYRSFNIYEVDKNDTSVIVSNSLNHLLYKQYNYKIWNKINIL